MAARPDSEAESWGGFTVMESDHTIDEQSIDPPPEPPDIRRRFRPTPLRLAVFAGLGLVVVLALAGLFGRGTDVIASRSTSLELAVEYPTRFRFEQISPLRIEVRNLTGRSLDTLRIIFDPSYVEAFSDVSATPSFGQAWEVELHDVRPDETRRVFVQLQADAYGAHEGTVSAVVRGVDSVAAPLRTMIFP